MRATRLFYSNFPALSNFVTNFETILVKAYLTRIRVKFLKDCLAEHVLPKSLLPHRLRRLSDIPFDDFSAIILKKHIKETKFNEFKLFKELQISRNKFFAHIPNDWHNILLDTIYSKLRRKISFINKKLNKKLSILMKESPWSKNSNEKVLINLSSTNIDNNTITALGYGMKFATTRRPTASSIANSIHVLEKKSSISSQQLDITKGIIYRCLLTQPIIESNIPRRFSVSINKLKTNESIHITKADKCNSFVILDKINYIEKMNELLSDQNTYKKLIKDPLPDIIKHFNSQLKILLKGNKDLIEHLTVKSPRLSYMYGLVKTHKEGYPMRPIISSVGSINYKLSKYLVSLLSPLLGKISGSHIKNNNDLIEKLNKTDIDCNSRLVSFDIVSLFTKVPIYDLLDFLNIELQNHTFQLDNCTIINLIKLCIVDCKFTFNNEFYLQCFGMAMGNPLSPLLSGLYMEFFERKFLPSLNIHWVRYVDDCLCVLPVSINIPDLLHALNEKVPSINFTVEEESDCFLPFLDVGIHRRDHCLIYNVHRKRTNNLAYIHNYSSHSSKVKESVFLSMYLRALRICSPEFFDNEINTIAQIGGKLGYSVCFLEKCFTKARKIFYENGYINNNNNIDFKNTLVLPYHNSFDNLPHILKYFKINVTFKFNNTFENYLIKNSPNNSSNIIYKIPCNDCNKYYIGQTSKPLDFRIKQHKYNVKNYYTSSALFLHSWHENHKINWTGSEIIIKSNNWFQRNFIESAIINFTKNNINISKGLFYFDPISEKLAKNDLKNILDKLI